MKTDRKVCESIFMHSNLSTIDDNDPFPRRDVHKPLTKEKDKVV